MLKHNTFDTRHAKIDTNSYVIWQIQPFILIIIDIRGARKHRKRPLKKDGAWAGHAIPVPEHEQFLNAHPTCNILM